jgi:WD40 repeat protein
MKSYRTMKSCRATAILLAICVGVGALSAQEPEASKTGAEEPKTRDIVRIPSGDPQLRIHINGHTGVVRAVAFAPDSVRLCSAGLDKVVHVWNLRAAPRDLQGAAVQERTIRWQVARGLRGGIQAIACAPSDGLLAFGGYGAMGSLGEILLVDPVQGSLDRVLEGHLQPICSLAFAADGNWLASMDTEGHAMVWKRGQWKPQVLYAPDEKTYGLEKSRIIGQQPKLRPVAILGSTHVVLPVYLDKEADGRPIWKLQQIRLGDVGDVQTYDTVHHGVITALAAASDGGRLASADLEGNLFLRDVRSGRVVSLKPGATVLSLAFSPDGRMLVVGTAIAGDSGTAQMQVWDVRRPRARLRRQSRRQEARLCRRQEP